MKDKFLWSAILVAFALAAHFAVPWSHMTTETEGGTESGTYWPPGFAAREAFFDPVAGGSMGYALAGLIVAFVGVWGLFIAHKAGAIRTRNGLGLVAGAGVIMTVHAQALWAGRSVATLIHVFLGTDGPSPAHLATSSDAFVDHYSQFWAISPWIVLPAIIAAAWLFLRALAEDTPRAANHAKTGQWALLALALVFVLPWSMETLPDRFEADPADEDPFIMSMYDVLRLNADTGILADDLGEAGIESYTELAWLQNALIIVCALALGSAIIGIHGAWLGTQQQAVAGRTYESVIYAQIAFVAGAIIAIILGAVAWSHNNDRVDAQALFVPILAAVALVPAFGAMTKVIREILQGQDSLIADDFPEPIIYD